MPNVSQQKPDNHTNAEKAPPASLPQDERLLQYADQSVATALCYDDEHGRIVASRVKVQEFIGNYRELVERVLPYWQQHDRAPGVHTADLIDDHLIGEHQAIWRGILSQMHEVYHDPSWNGRFVAEALHKFQHMRALNGSIIKEAEAMNRGELATVLELREATRHLNYQAFDKGISPGDLKATPALLDTADEFSSGIRALDRRHATPQRGMLTFVLAATGKGKTTWLAQIGKSALVQRKRVTHMTLEMSAQEVIIRYRQAWFVVPKRHNDKIEIARFQRKGGKLIIDEGRIIPEFNLDDDDANAQLRHRMPNATMPDFSKEKYPITAKARWRSRRRRQVGFDQLTVKEFLDGSLSIGELRGYLLQLQQLGQLPDLLIVDYVQIMEIKAGAGREYRHEVGKNMLGLRSLAREFNIAVVTAMQTNRAGAKAETVEHGDVAEDWSTTNTADTIISYSQTKPEREHGLARLNVSKNRGAKDGFEVAITQNYACGQFALGSTLVDDEYKKLRDTFVKGDHDDETKPKLPSTKDRVLELRKEGKSQTDIARELGISQQGVSKILKSVTSI